MREILSTEQPCILCGMALEVVTVHRDDDTNEERIERVRLDHDDRECGRMIALYPEIWPGSQRNGSRS